MNYEQLIETISAIVENEKIHKTGLVLVYTLNDTNHKKMNEELFYRANQDPTKNVDPVDEFEVELGGILVKFIKEKKDLES